MRLALTLVCGAIFAVILVAICCSGWGLVGH